MKCNNKLGEFGFRAVCLHEGVWSITEGFFFTQDEVNTHFRNYPSTHFKWPVEQIDSDIVYIPTQAELEQ